MADTKVCQRCSKVLRIGKLLLSIHIRLYVYCETITWHGKERQEVGVDKKAGESIRGVEEKVYTRTGVSSTGFRQKNEDGSRCFRLCDGRHVVNKKRRQIMKAGSIPLKIFKWNKEELQDSW